MAADIIEQVALVTGHILHEGTGEPIFGSVRIVERQVKDEDKLGTVADKLLDDEEGTFVVSGEPMALFPNLALQAYTLNLEIRARSPQFRQGMIIRPLLVPISRGETFEPPIDVGVIFLLADSVNIRGRVLNAQNPENAIADAGVEILQNGAVTDATTTGNDGRYRFDGLVVQTPVAEPAQIRCSKTDFRIQARMLLIDFGKLVNEENFRLPPL
ncbi:MAG: MSCRAMM family protein [bacterium]